MTFLYHVSNCDFCQNEVYETLNNAHFRTCIGARVLYSIIPVDYLPFEKERLHLQEVLGTNPTTERLVAEPGIQFCGYCKQIIAREILAYHVLYCRSGCRFISPDKPAKTSFKKKKGLRVEFYLFFFSFSYRLF